MVEAESKGRTPGPTEGAAGRLQELAEDECWELLAQQSVGRISWTAPDGPAVVPVNYGIEGRALWIRTSAYAALVREADQSRVAVEVDDLDAAERSGWSVVVRGTAQVRFPNDAGPTPPTTEVWPSGARPLWVVVDPREVTGRRLVGRPGAPT